MRPIINDILDISARVPGVCQEDNVLLLDSGDGSGRMDFYPLWPGITLASVRVQATRWPESDINDTLHPLLVNYCVAGRSELSLDDGSYIYLQPGDCCVSIQTAQEAYIFPTGCYNGLKLYLDLPLLAAGENVLEAFDLDPAALVTRFCTRRGTTILETSGPLRETLQALWQLLARTTPDPFYIRQRLLELLHLLLNASPSAAKPCSFYTETQVALAKHAATLLTADLSRHLPIREVAANLGISETSLKNYFRGVYGQNISSYLRQQRVEAAAQLLVTSNRPVADIAAQVGYSNQGKFAAVFRAHFGTNPLDYRRRARLNHT